MKRIYVAGASAELDLVRGYIRQLNAAGWNITYDWTEAVAKFGSAGEALTDEVKKELAKKDFDGVFYANVFWLLAPQGKGVGAWIEYGYAKAAREFDRDPYLQTIIVSGTTDSIFALLADKRFATHDEALAWLIGWMP